MDACGQVVRPGERRHNGGCPAVIGRARISEASLPERRLVYLALVLSARAGFLYFGYVFAPRTVQTCRGCPPFWGFSSYPVGQLFASSRVCMAKRAIGKSFSEWKILKSLLGAYTLRGQLSRAFCGMKEVFENMKILIDLRSIIPRRSQYSGMIFCQGKQKFIISRI